MTDITMCHGMKSSTPGKDFVCPLKSTCYRAEAIQSKWQSFFVDLPYDEDIKVCEFYWKISETPDPTIYFD